MTFPLPDRPRLNGITVACRISDRFGGPLWVSWSSPSPNVSTLCEWDLFAMHIIGKLCGTSLLPLASRVSWRNDISTQESGILGTYLILQMKCLCESQGERQASHQMTKWRCEAKRTGKGRPASVMWKYQKEILLSHWVDFESGVFLQGNLPSNHKSVPRIVMLLSYLQQNWLWFETAKVTGDAGDALGYWQWSRGPKDE